MKSSTKLLGALGALMLTGTAFAAGADVGQAAKQETNWTAIIMFTAFVIATLGITKWAAGRTKSAADLVLAAAHLVTHSVPATKMPNMPMAVQLVGCLATWPRSPPAATAAPAARLASRAARSLIGALICWLPSGFLRSGGRTRRWHGAHRYR